MKPYPHLVPEQMAEQIKRWGRDMGFQQIGISDTELSTDEVNLLNWLKLERHGEMHYMEKHGSRRARPAELIPGTLRIIVARMDYAPKTATASEAILDDPERAFISRYALGRDYHKVMRSRLTRLAKNIEQVIGDYAYRVFTDSAPVMEKPLARHAGLGWQGKHTNLINDKAGSWFFLGEIYTDLPLPVDEPYASDHCGSCHACIDVCPTDAIVAPYELDARRCISYLTIELRGSIPEEYRKLIGNRIYGCDDCQIFCPWNKFAQISTEQDYQARNQLDDISLLECFSWTEEQFLHKTEGSAIRRIGYECWLRNIAVALGNTGGSTEVISALKEKHKHTTELVKEHIEWALQQFDHAN